VSYCYSLLTDQNPTTTPCHDDVDCGTKISGDCTTFNECSGNTSYRCPTAGQPCTATGVRNLGTCRQFDPISVCTDDTSCNTATYAAAAAEIATLPGAAKALTNAIQAHMPNGNTPTEAALTGALQHARAWAEDHPDHKVIVLLATDGLPTNCISDPNDTTGINGVRAAAAAGLADTPSVSTYVIGVFAPSDTSAQMNLDQIARAGGSDSAFLVDAQGDVEQAFLNDLDTIRGERLPCEFQIPDSDNGNRPAYNLVNVTFTEGGDSSVLYYWDDPKSCDAKTGGWYYDVSPDAGTPSKIVACPASCDALQGATDGHVSIQLGCKTIVK
jgi:hypothetical protein